MVNQAMIEEMLWTNPLSLLVIKDEQVIQQLNELIPYSTAFEIECHMVGVTNYSCEQINKHNDTFKNIPDIISVSNDTREQRYRIPNGLRGVICVYHISEQLKVHSLLNPHSSIHYHVDCTDCFSDICDLIRRSENTEYILSELDTWLEEDTARNRDIGYWFKLNDLQTVEFRLGEMTFDYKRILKRIIHVNAMVKKFKDELGLPLHEFQSVNKQNIINYRKQYKLVTNFNYTKQLEIVTKELEELKKETPIVDPMDEVRASIRNRTHKINPSK